MTTDTEAKKAALEAFNNMPMSEQIDGSFGIHCWKYVLNLSSHEETIRAALSPQPDAEILAEALEGMIYLKEGGNIQQEIGIYKQAKKALEQYREKK